VSVPKCKFGAPGSDASPTAGDGDNFDRQFLSHFTHQRLFLRLPEFDRAAWEAKLSWGRYVFTAAYRKHLLAANHYANDATFAFDEGFWTGHGHPYD
jgi:hypothetical protein